MKAEPLFIINLNYGGTVMWAYLREGNLIKGAVLWACIIYAVYAVGQTFIPDPPWYEVVIDHLMFWK